MLAMAKGDGATGGIIGEKQNRLLKESSVTKKIRISVAAESLGAIEMHKRPKPTASPARASLNPDATRRLQA
jgi:hypothetical protein